MDYGLGFLGWDVEDRKKKVWHSTERKRMKIKSVKTDIGYHSVE